MEDHTDELDDENEKKKGVYINDSDKIYARNGGAFESFYADGWR